MARVRILVIDDEPQIRRLLRDVLAPLGYDLQFAGTGRDALASVEAQTPDVILLDIGLPDVDGFTLCEELRELTGAGILMLTAHREDQEKVRGLQAGADDYVTKPFSPAELAARVAALVRRVRGDLESARGAVYDDGTVRLEPAHYRVIVAGQETDLTRTEATVLRLLLRYPGRVLTTPELLRQVWGSGYEDAVGSLRNVIASLRRKIEPQPGQPQYLITHAGVGYRFQPASAERRQQAGSCGP